MTTVIPNVVADGVTDDRAVIQAAIDSLPTSGGTVYLKKGATGTGQCFIGTAGVSGGGDYGLAITRSNVTLTGDAGAGIVGTVPGMRLLVAGGIGLTEPTNPVDNNTWITSATAYTPPGAIAQGATSITLASAADAAHFTAGDVVFIRTGSCTASALLREPDAELNVVTAVSGAVLNLKFPTKKPYVPEFLLTSGATANDTSSPSGQGAACVYGVAKMSPNCLTGFTLRGLTIDMQDPTSGQAMAVWLHQAWGVVVDSCTIKSGKYGLASRYTRGVHVANCSFYSYGSSSTGDPAWVAPSTGSSDWLMEGCSGTAAAGIPAKLHLHEGLSDIKYVGWTSTADDGPGQSGASPISIRARAYRHYHDLTMTGAYTASGSSFCVVNSNCVGPVYFARLKLTGNPGGYFLNVADPAARIEQAQLATSGTPGSGTSLYSNGAASGTVLVTGGTDPTNVVLGGPDADPGPQITRVGAAVATAGASTTTTSCTATLPAGIAAGDLLIVAVDRTNDYPLTQGTPTGWKFIRNILDVGTSPNAGQTDLYYRIADGTETTIGPAFTTATVTRWIIHAAAYRGVNPAAPFLAEGAVTQATNVAAHASPTLTNTDGTAWAVFAVLGRGTSPVSWTPDPALTERLDTDLGVTNSANIYAEWSDSNGPVSPGSYTYTATASAASNIGTHWLGLLRPLAAALPHTYVLAPLASNGASTAPLTGNGASTAPLLNNGASTAPVSTTT